jgi:hypothetical protein
VEAKGGTVGAAGLGLRILGVAVMAAVTILVTVAVADRFRGASTATGVAGAIIIGVVAVVMLRRVPTTTRWLVSGLAIVGVGAVALSLISLFQPTPDQLVSVTRIIHESDLRAQRQLHSAGFVQNTASFCLSPCERRFEQSDFSAPVPEALADIERRLREAGYTTSHASGPPWFVGFDPPLDRTVVMTARGKGLTVTVSVAPTESGSVVASVAE